jgi:alkylation response protein AidB-like acyl-CoA dehydrogenase
VSDPAAEEGPAAGLDLSLDEAQQALADAVARFCRDRCPDAVVRDAAEPLPRALWRELADLGILAISTPEGDGGAQEVLAAMESLGRAAFPGPLAETFLAAQLLPETERRAVTAGEVLVAAGSPPLLAWAPLADVFVELDGESAWLAKPAGAIESVATLGGEPWGRCSLERRRALGDATRARALGDLALAAWLAAAGRRLVEDAAAHAQTRRQFGRLIASFQAVSHPLAAAAIDLDAAATLARLAAWHWDAGDPRAAAGLAAAARLAAASAAPEAARAAHQTFGAQGVTVAGPVFHVSRRIVQLALGAPGLDRAREAVLAPLGIAPQPGRPSTRGPTSTRA